MADIKKYVEFENSWRAYTFKKGDLAEKKGSFLLGYTNPLTGKFVPRYVGSSFTDLEGEIFASMAREKNKGLTQFRYELAFSDIHAWQQECYAYHLLKDTNELTNERHPKRPEDYTYENLKCPNLWCED